MQYFNPLHSLAIIIQIYGLTTMLQENQLILIHLGLGYYRTDEAFFLLKKTALAVNYCETHLDSEPD